MKQISIAKFRRAIKHLPSDERHIVPGIWYMTQKEHWLGWLKEYTGPGAYGRKNWKHDAQFVYNHVVCPEMLLFLIRSLPLHFEKIQWAEEACNNAESSMEKVGAIRKIASWKDIESAIWGKRKNHEN